MKKQLQRLISMVLVLCMVLSVLPGEAAAYFVAGVDHASQDYTGEITVLGEDGSTETVDYDESWEEVYPYGAFVFGNYEAAVTEGSEDGSTVTIQVYRLGGTTGRATAYIHYQPAMTQDTADSMTYAYAASGRDDIVIEVEDPQPVAQYQPVGMDRIYAGCDLSVEQGVEDGQETDYQLISLTEDVGAEEYVWQQAVVRITEDEEYEIVQSWMSLETESKPELQVDNDIWFSNDVYYDFRCLYTVDGKTYCTATAWEVPFSEADEELEDMPSDIELNAEPTYSVLNFENEYDDCVFALTFAENEWVKNIIVTVKDDEIPELPEMGLFTLVDCEGGEVFGAANTLTLLVNDNDPHEPSQLGFKATFVEADQDTGSVTVTVERTGGTTYPVTVEYTTVNGTAEAGKQFSSSSGTLMFAGDVTSIDISIPLVAQEERAETLEFSVVLSELKGAGEDYICTLENDTVTVSLTSSGKAVGLESGLNLASVLATASGEDVSAAGTVTEAMLPESTTVTGEQDTTTAPEIVGNYVQGSGNSRTYHYQSGVQLRRGDSYSGYWNDWENVVGTKSGDSSGTMNYYTKFRDATFVKSSHTIEDKYGGKDAMEQYHASSSVISIQHNNSTDVNSLWTLEYAGTLFSNVEYRFEWPTIGIARHARNADDYIYVMPYCWITTKATATAGTKSIYSDDWTGNASRFTDSDDDDWITRDYSYPQTGTVKSHTLSLSEKYMNVATSLVLNKNGSQMTFPSASESDQKRGANGSSKVSLTKLYLQRRTFKKNGDSTIGLTVHTANDADSGLGSLFAQLDDSTGVYNSMKPEVSLVAGKSGVTTSGNLYVGSQLKISLKSTASYFAALGNELSYGIYLTNSKGEKKNVKVEGSGSVYYMTLLWDGMTEADLNETYTINVVMERRQTVTLDINPSLADGATEDDIKAMWKTVMGQTKSNASLGYFTYGYSETKSASANGKITHFQYSANNRADDPKAISEREMYVTYGEGKTEFTNLQWINFNLDPEDIILFGGRSYAGNETIYLSMADLATKELTFYYYNKDTLSLPSTMVATIAETALYYDGNGNGQIDGYFDATTGYFVVDEESGDQDLGFVSGEFDETAFQPVVEVVNGRKIVHQYFLKVYYTMNPRSLQAPAGINQDATTTVLPVLMSTVTDRKAFGELTTQQQSYRYLQAGYTLTSDSATDYTDSSQGHPMYGKEAAARTYVDIPLGGDTSPVSYELTTTEDGVQTKVYTWEPDYYGNLLVSFNDPEPINNDQNITGQTVTIAGEEPTWKSEGKKRTMTLTDEGKAKVNAYLGAMTGNTTFGLAVDAHLVSTRPLTSLDFIDPESIAVGNVKAVPNGEYLANTESSGDPDAAEGGSGGESAMPEFEMDLGVTLPSTDFKLGDYATIIMDGSSVGFSVGLPIASTEEKSTGKVDWGEEFKNANDGLNTMKDFASSVLNKNGTQKFKDIMGDSYNDAKGGKGGSHGFEFAMSVAFTILFEYNPIDNTYYFKQAALAASVSFEFTIQYRFSMCPILYIYLKTGLEINVATGFSVARTAKEGSKIATSDWLSGVDGVTSKGLGVTLDRGESACFVVDISDVRGFHLYMDGNVYMEVLKADRVEQYKQDPNSYSGKYVASGRLSSDGDEAVEVFLEDGNYRAYVVLTALEPTAVYSAVEVTGAKSLVYWDGLQFSPSGFIEVGAGIGIELLKFELYLRASAKLAFTIGGYSVDAGNYRGAKLDSFDFSASLGFNVTVLFINYSMDLIGYYLHIEDTGAGRKVESKWGAFGGALGGDTRSAGESSGGSLIGVSAPTDTSNTQRVAGEGSKERAYDPTDDNAPFQLSGYGTSGDGFKLMEGLSTGNSYQVFRVGEDNYILYTKSRSDAVNALDTPQLVLSRVVLTGSEATRLQSPVGSGTCLAVDQDDTGDLDYSCSVDGNTLTVIWTSYDEVSDADVDATDAAAASRRTVVKTASIDLSGSDGFSEPTVLTDTIGDFRYLPQQEGSVSIYAEGTGGDDQSASLKAYLKVVYGMTDAEAESGTTTNYDHAAAVYRWNYQSDLNAMYGSANKLVAGEAEAQLSTGEIIENIETTTIDGTVYVAYSTIQYAYFDADGLTAATIDGSCDLASVKRLYLRTFDGEAWAEAKLLQTVIDFDRCDNNGAFCLTDGVYSGGSLETQQLDPYFSNLKFLDAKLSSSESAETVFLYEMGGNTYVIDQEGISNAMNGGTFTITPIFTTSDGSSEGTDAVIASDHEGNLAVVYTAPMNATGSNALYVAWWDTNLGQWGTGNVLAMNHLQVFEDAAKYGLSAEELEQAYLGEDTGNDEYDAYIGEADESARGDMEQLTFSNLQITLAGGEESGEQLLVMTQGSLQQLTTTTVTNPITNETSCEVAPYGDPDMGFYAVSFGAGQQGIGQANLSLTDYDFTAGSSLSGTLSFVNTGTTAIRASSTEPATVSLTAYGEGYSQTIAQWSITESVPSGGKVELDFRMTDSLTADLPTGTVFSASISEDESYVTASGGTAFSASTGELLKVEAKPELQIESFTMDLTGISGDNATFQVDLWVSDRGNVDAENVFVQFSYEKEGEEVEYLSLKLTGSSLEVEKEAQVDRSVTSDDLSNGIVSVGHISKGYQRRIHGTLSVPVSSFRQDDISGLHVKAEVFSDADTTSLYDGLYSSSHKGEYSASNNIWTQELGHETFFQTPGRISMAMGNTLRLPISYSTTSAAGAEISVKEVSDGTADWTANLGILHYDAASGTIVAAPSADTAGKTGIIQVEDQATNSIYAIAYTITELGDGINIYKDDESFTFYNANGSETNVTSKTEDWRFNENVSSWDGGTSGAETPMNSDTVYASKSGAYLTFQTTADTMTLWFIGEVTVSSSLGTSSTGKSDKLKDSSSYPMVIDFSNDAGALHTVTVTAKAGTVLDRYTATYVEYPVQTDENGPQIFWSRSFPDTASMKPGSSVTLTCYVVDDSQLLEIGGIPADTVITKTSQRFWSFPVTITENGTMTVKATDSSGKTTSYPLRIDWFNSLVTSGAVATVPAFPGTSVELQDESGNAISGPLAENEYPYVKSTYVCKEGETIAVMPSDGTTAITPESDGRWKLTENGVYLVRVTAADGSWTQVVLVVECIDDGTFTIRVTDDADERKLTVTVGESKAYTLTGLNVNGYSILEDGTFSYTLGGDYTVNATNSQGRTVSTTVRAAVPLTMDDDAITTTGCTNYNAQEGTVTVSLGGIHGGSYDEGASAMAENRYEAVYEAALVAVEGEDAVPDTTNASWVSSNGGAFTFTNLSHGWYRVVIRDSQGNTCISGAFYINNGLSVTVTDDPAARNLTITVGSQDPVTQLSVNGCSILEQGEPFTFAYTLGGDYTVNAANSLGRTASASVMAAVPLTMDDDAITITSCTHYNTKDGTVTVSLGGIHGGSYDEGVSAPAENRYEAVYEAALVAVEGKNAAPDTTNASWVSSNGGAFTFTNLSHGWYRVVIRDTQGNTCIADAFYVNNGLSVTVTDEPASRNLTITVGSQDELTKLSVNGYSILEQGEPYTFPYTLGGDYSVHAENTTEGSDDASITVSVPLTLDKNALTTTSCTSAIQYNGAIALGLDGVQGGSYDETASTPAENRYEATYTAALLSLRSKYADPGDKPLARAEWISANDGVFRFKVLRVGWYQLLVRDSRGNTASMRVYVDVESAGDSGVVIEEPEHGTIIITPEDPDSGEEVAIVAKPDDGYTLGELTVTDEDGSELTLTRKPDGSYAFTMPDGTVTIRAVFVPIAFRDVTKTDYFYDAVVWAVENGITNGTGDGVFGPDLACTRAQAVTFLWRAAGSPTPTGRDMPFNDVAPGSYYYDAVLWAVENGITKGTDDVHFSPDLTCTRGQIVTFLWRSQDAPMVSGDELFADVASTAYYAGAVQWAVKNGITRGTDAATFSPDAVCTRAQIVTFLYRSTCR